MMTIAISGEMEMEQKGAGEMTRHHLTPGVVYHVTISSRSLESLRNSLNPLNSSSSPFLLRAFDGYVNFNQVETANAMTLY